MIDDIHDQRIRKRGQVSTKLDAVFERELFDIFWAFRVAHGCKKDDTISGNDLYDSIHGIWTAAQDLFLVVSRFFLVAMPDLLLLLRPSVSC